MNAPYILNLSHGPVKVWLEDNEITEVQGEYDEDELVQAVAKILEQLPTDNDEVQPDLEAVQEHLRTRYETFLDEGFLPREAFSIAVNNLGKEVDTATVRELVEYFVEKGWTKEQALEVALRI